MAAGKRKPGGAHGASAIQSCTPCAGAYGDRGEVDPHGGPRAAVSRYIEV